MSLSAGRLEIGGEVQGVGFLLGSRLFATAAHCLSDAAQGIQVGYVLLADGVRIPVRRIYFDDVEYDLAVFALHLADAEVRVPPKSRRVISRGMKWYATERHPQGIALTGQIENTNASVPVVDGGPAISVMQLGEAHRGIRSYAGYSGGPAETDDLKKKPTTFAMILRQVLDTDDFIWRSSVSGEQEAVQVLYALPIEQIVARLSEKTAIFSKASDSLIKNAVKTAMGRRGLMSIAPPAGGR